MSIVYNILGVLSGQRDKECANINNLMEISVSEFKMINFGMIKHKQ